jgi:hypothetical protein
MRTLLVLAALAAAPSARAELRLALPEPGLLAPPAPTLGVPVLSMEVVAPPAPVPLPGAGAGYGGADPAISLLLGIIPGFGMGHLIANSPRWTTWLVVDVILLAVWVITPYTNEPFGALVFVGSVVERVFEGIDAFRSAGGRGLADAGPPPGSLLALAARPVSDPAAPGLKGR